MPFITPLCYLAVMVFGIVGRATRFFPKETPRLLYKVVLYFTLPAAVVCAFEGFSRDWALFALVGGGFVCALVPFLAAFFILRKKPLPLRAYGMLNASGLNVGCFSLAIVSGVFGPTGAVAACLFDVGNALLMTGGSYALTTTLLRLTGEKGALKAGIKRLFSSVPFDAYLIMLLLSLLDCSPPAVLTAWLQPIAGANGFLAMLAAGASFDVSQVKPYLKSALAVLSVRLCYAAALASVAYFCLPFAHTVRCALVMVAFSPVSALAPTFSDACCGEGARSGFTMSFSVVVSLAVMCVLCFVLT